MLQNLHRGNCNGGGKQLIVNRLSTEALNYVDAGNHQSVQWPLATICNLGIVLLAYVVALAFFFGVAKSAADLGVFVACVTASPVFAALVLKFFMRPDFSNHQAGPGETINFISATALIAFCSVLALAAFILSKEASFWRASSWYATLFVLFLHLSASIFLLLNSRNSALLLRWVPLWAQSRRWHFIVSVLVFFLGMLLVFRVEPDSAYFNMLFSYFFARGFDAGSSTGDLLSSLAFAIVFIATCVALYKVEVLFGRSYPHRLAAVQTTCLLSTILLLWIFYFDFAFALNTFHFLTNISPALSVLHGGTLMVDTFSQYGPGPVVATMLGFSVSEPSFSNAGVVVQVHNLAFYSLFLFCLYKATPYKLPALALGFFAITILFSGWWGGRLNVNSVPSALGLRYLPTMLMVTALVILKPGRRHSWLTLFAGFLSALWSVETCIGTIGVQVAFLGLENLRSRSIPRALRDVFAVLLPLLAAFATISAYTLLAAGEWPQYSIYLQFLSRYNMLSDYWSIPASGLFWGWLPVYLSVFLVLTVSWIRVFSPSAVYLPIPSEVLFSRFVPFAIFTSFTASYFAGRSVDFTLIIALLPFCILFIPGLLAFSVSVSKGRGAEKLLLVIPFICLLWPVSFSSLAVYRDNSPYSLLLHEVRRHQELSVDLITRAFTKGMQRRPVLEKDVGHQYLLDDEGVVRDGIRAVELFAPEQDQLALFLGLLQSQYVASDVALLYLNKAHRWPISYTFSDELLAQLAERIINASVTLQEGEVVIVRKDRSKLGHIQGRIVEDLEQSFRLCPVAFESATVEVFKVGLVDGSCPG